jgi:hypothetical protein
MATLSCFLLLRRSTEKGDKCHGLTVRPSPLRNGALSLPAPSRVAQASIMAFGCWRCARAVRYVTLLWVQVGVCGWLREARTGRACVVPVVCARETRIARGASGSSECTSHRESLSRTRIHTRTFHRIFISTLSTENRTITRQPELPVTLSIL